MTELVRSSMVPVAARKYAYRLLRSGSKPTSPVSDEKRSFSWKNAFCAVNTALRFAFASLCFDRAWNLMKFGIAIAARMPMIATTIINSISVKPFWTSLFIGAPLWKRWEEGEQATGQAMKSRRSAEVTVWWRVGQRQDVSRRDRICQPTLDHPAGRLADHGHGVPVAGLDW